MSADTSQVRFGMDGHGDLGNTRVGRAAVELTPGPPHRSLSLTIDALEDNQLIRDRYRPFLQPGNCLDGGEDWITQLELGTVLEMVQTGILDRGLDRLKILVLYGSLRKRSYSCLLAYEAARILFRLGCDVRVFDPRGLPVKDDEQHTHAKVQELRALSEWSNGHVWISPEQHGNLTGVFKQQIDWIPLSSGSVRPTQGRTLAIAQVCGGSQSFNTVNSLRILGRWMRMFTIPNQSSVPHAYTQFTPEAEGSRMMASSNRDRLVDCMEELVKYTIIMRPNFHLFGDRFSERQDLRIKREEEEKRKAEILSNIMAGAEVGSATNGAL